MSETDKVLLPQAFHSVLQGHLQRSEADAQTFSFLLGHHIGWFIRLLVCTSATNETETHFLNQSVKRLVLKKRKLLGHGPEA